MGMNGTDGRTDGEQSLMQPPSGTTRNNSRVELTCALVADIVQRCLLIWEQQIHFEVLFTADRPPRRRRLPSAGRRTSDRKIKDSLSRFSSIYDDGIRHFGDTACVDDVRTRKTKGGARRGASSVYYVLGARARTVGRGQGIV